jgi:FtsP/CotA-like multicopper oxidase with cupredoxin domain
MEGMNIGGDMSGMNMGGTLGAGKESMPGMKMENVPATDMGSMPGMKHEMPPASKTHKMHGAHAHQPHGMHQMHGMKMGPASAPHHEMKGMKTDNMSGTKMNGEMSGMKMEGVMPGMKMNQPSASPATGRPSVEIPEGPEVAGVAIAPTDKLSDPGEGFPPGRRVLAYSDLRARYKGTDPRLATREIELHLTGNMQRFIWGFDGKKFTEADPIKLNLGERVRFTLINDSMMEHPIHLHGLWSELDNGHAEFRPYKHTINVKPGQRLSYLVSADTPGHWAFHCHLLYHMEAGMFRTVIVS